MLQATRSQIFKNMLDSDECKAPPMDTITLSELNFEELECLLEFLYTGSLAKEKVEKHVYSLSVAADKYEISYLQKFCERHMFRSLNSSNALDVLEISDICSYISLKETALNFIVKNMEDIAFSVRYDEFALKNPHLCVQITRASLMEAKKKVISL
jgi:speckle-type POZ protein